MAEVPKRTSVTRPGKTWHAVSIVTHTVSCEAVLLCRNQRYLSLQAPRLPLTNCSLVQGCNCTFKHHDDRRAGPRRASESGRPPRLSALPTERRATQGRRQSDS